MYLQDTIDVRGIALPNVPDTGEINPENNYTIGNNVTSDIAVRKALNYGINRTALAEGALNGLGYPSYDGIAHQLPWANKDAVIEDGDVDEAKKILKELDYETLLLLASLFVVIQGITSAGVITKLSELLVTMGGDSVFLMYTIIVFASVLISAFVDNIPYVLTMLPVVTAVAANMNVEPYVLYFGLLVGATLGGNITPIGASANITGIGILRKEGYEVKAWDFMKISIPFTLTAVLSGYLFIWLFWGL